ncbi:MAG: SRPBCC domain-containing protein [Defluviitaleaceae bacterium]|nr:SRPBCC domain-containing protein [Defluviitaleaceae bacterium]
MIKLTKTYNASKEAVWKHLVDDELLSGWCMPCKGFALEIGQKFDFNIKPNAFFSGIFNNTVTDFKEFAHLSYRCTSSKPKLYTIVKWELNETDGKTTLSLEHSGFRGSQFLTKAMLRSGWKKMMDKHLEAVL